jgi:hypothetical protein
MTIMKENMIDPFAEKRDNLFALRSMFKFAGVGASSELTEHVMSICVQNRMYHRIVRSLVWELDLPFCMMCNKYEGFPWRQIPTFKENIQAVRSSGPVPQNVLRTAQAKARRTGSKKDKDDLEVLERKNMAFNQLVERMHDVELYTLIENESLRDVMRSAEDLRGDTGKNGFASFDVRKHAEVVAEELLETLLDEDDSLKLGLINYRLTEFNLAAWDILEYLKEPIRDLIVDSWQNHAMFLADALSSFDFRSNRVRVNNYLAVENVPLDVSEAHLKTFLGIGERAVEIIEALHDVNEEICRIEVGDKDDVEVQGELAVRRDRYVMLQDSLQIFADRTKGEPESVLCICDCSPTGFLNNPMPII